MSNEHTIIITSNVQDERNQSNHFFNVLNTPLHLEGHWRVGVKKLIYLNNFLNIVNEKIACCIIGEYSGEASVLLLDGKADASILKDERSGTLYRPIELGVENVIVNVHGMDKKKERFHQITVQVNYNPDERLWNREFRYSIEYTLDEDTTWHHLDQYTFDKYGLEKGNFLKSSILLPHLKATRVRVKFFIEQVDEYVIPPGNYGNAQDLIRAIPNIRGVKWSISRITGRIRIHFNKKEGLVPWIKLLNDLNLTMGFRQSVFDGREEILDADFMPQLNRGRFAFFIYSNIVNNVRVGNMEVPLLDVVNIPKTNFAEIISVDVVSPLYRDVSVRNIHEIEIKLATDSGELITFNNQSGNAKTLLVLHFTRSTHL